MDTTVAENLKQSFTSIKLTTKNAQTFTKDLNGVLDDLRHGKGLVGYLLGDTVSVSKLRMSIDQIHEASEKASQVTRDLKQATEKIKRGDGAAGLILNDTTFQHDLSKSMHNIRLATEALNVNMEAMRHNFLFRGYFKEQDKKQEKGNGAIKK